MHAGLRWKMLLLKSDLLCDIFFRITHVGRRYASILRDIVIPVNNRNYLSGKITHCSVYSRNVRSLRRAIGRGYTFDESVIHSIIHISCWEFKLPNGM